MKDSKRLIFCIFSSRSSSRFSVDVVEFTASSGKFRGGVALYPKVSEVRFDARLAKFVLLFVVVVVSAISPVARTIEFKRASSYCAISFKIFSLLLRASNKADSCSLASVEAKAPGADIDFAVVVAVVAVVAAAGARISSSFSTIFPSSFFVTSSIVVVALTTSNGVSTTSTFVSTFLSFDFISKFTFSSLFLSLIHI